ncbi:MAG TPA: ABC transporter ATP-binding protein [Streptosporangiaceae bacterium]
MTARGVATGTPLIEVRGLRVDYGAGPGAVHAVVDADLTLHSGTVLGLAGESGSGKSTLAYAMTRLLRAPGMITGGEVLLHDGAAGTGGYWQGQNASHGPPVPASADGRGHTLDLLAATEDQLRELRWSRIAVVMQSAMHSLNPVLTIRSQLTDVLKAHLPGMDREARGERAGKLLEMVGIGADRLSSYPHQLSGGMRQRVMIAMALALEPAVVIMDEPTTALDVVTQREILQELTQLQQELSFAVLFITHDLSLLVEIADSIAVMYAGRLIERAPAQALYRAPRHPYTLGLLGSFPALHGPRRKMTGIPGSPPDLRNPPSGCAFHPRCQFAMDVCRTDVPMPISLVPGNRSAACWLQDGHVSVPPELAASEPGTAASPPSTVSPQPARSGQAAPEKAGSAS